MKSLTEMCLTWVLVACVGACAHGGAAGAASASDDLTQPQMITRVAPPAIQVPPSPQSGRPSLRVDVEVLIDEIGRPDMSTFKVTGIVTDENRAALRTWIEQASFRPAQHAGQPVPGVFRTRLRATSTTRRIS